MDLKDKPIVITGAARGLGAAMAKRLAARQPRLALVDLSADSIAETAAACRAIGRPGTPFDPARRGAVPFCVVSGTSGHRRQSPSSQPSQASRPAGWLAL